MEGWEIMISLIVENENNEKLDLMNPSYFDSVTVDGLTPGKASINTTVIANSDGSLINNARNEDRPITIDIEPAFPIEENRLRIYQFFKRKKYITLYVKTTNRDLKIEGMVESVEGSLFVEKQSITIEILCNDPYFKDQLETYTNMARVLDLFEFPFSIEEEGKEFSRIEKTIEQTVINAGDTETGVIIEISASGTVINPTIYNTVTRESFGLNITMQSGDVITINTNNFQKKVELLRNGETTNIINSIIKGNKWFKLLQGDNLFTYTCDTGEEFLNIRFIYNNLYEGV